MNTALNTQATAAELVVLDSMDGPMTMARVHEIVAMVIKGAMRYQSQRGFVIELSKNPAFGTHLRGTVDLDMNRRRFNAVPIEKRVHAGMTGREVYREVQEWVADFEEIMHDISSFSSMKVRAAERLCHPHPSFLA